MLGGEDGMTHVLTFIAGVAITSAIFYFVIDHFIRDTFNRK